MGKLYCPSLFLLLSFFHSWVNNKQINKEIHTHANMYVYFDIKKEGDGERERERESLDGPSVRAICRAPRTLTPTRPLLPFQANFLLRSQNK